MIFIPIFAKFHHPIIKKVVVGIPAILPPSPSHHPDAPPPTPLPPSTMVSSTPIFSPLLLLPFMLLLLTSPPFTRADVVEDFCGSTASVDAYGSQASMVAAQGSRVQEQTDAFDAVAFMQQLRGGGTTGDSMSAIMKTHAWERKGLRYSQSLIFFAAPGIALGIIFFFFWFFMTMCRFCGK